MFLSRIIFFSFLLVFLLSSGCFNKKKDQQESIIAPASEDTQAPSISLGLPIFVNENDPVIRDYWWTLISKYVTDDTIEVQASFVDERKLGKFDFTIRPLLQLSKIKNGWEVDDSRVLSKRIQGYTNKFYIPIGIDAGYYLFTITCEDSAGNKAPIVKTKFYMKSVYDDTLPVVRYLNTSLDTNNYGLNKYDIGDTLYVRGFASDSKLLRYVDTRIMRKTSLQVINNIIKRDSILTTNHPIDTFWIVPAGMPVGTYLLRTRAVDYYNNTDSMTSEFSVQ